MEAKTLKLEDNGDGANRHLEMPSPEQQVKLLQWKELAESGNPLLKLAGSLYEQTGGVCEAVAGPGGIGVCTDQSSKIRIVFSFSPTPILNNVIFPPEIEQYKVELVGYMVENAKQLRRSEIKTLLQDADFATQKAAEALWRLAKETYMISTEECNEAFDILAKWEMYKAYGVVLSDNTDDIQQNFEETENDFTLHQF